MIFGKASLNQTARWEPAPTTRGSFQILSTCLITLGLCVWTAIHLNIPEQKPPTPRGKWDPRGWVKRHTWRRLGWLVLGLFAPEMVAFTAWSQRRDAKKFTDTMQHLLSIAAITDVESADNNKSRINAWTDVHSFYALMGGFAFSTHDLPPEKKFLPGNRELVIIQLRGLEYIAELDPSIIPDISEEEILDKSKASGFDKTIVCTQATWFLTQLVVRISQGVPISLLELSTAAHAICALLIYILWWEKPMRIERPTLISGERTHAICAGLCYATRFDGSSSDCSSVRRLRVDDKWQRPPTIVLPCAREVGYMSAEGNLRPDEVYRLYDCQCIGRFQYLRISRYPRRPILQREYLEYTARDVQRWQLASKWIDFRGESVSEPADGVRDRSPDWPSAMTEVDLRDAVSGIVGGEVSDEVGVPLLIGFSVAGILYGGLHLLAWTAPFHSRTHSVLWKVAAVNIATSGVYCAAYATHGALGRQLDNVDISERLQGVIEVAIFLFDFGLFSVAALFYMFSRGFLVVECFISLAYLPPEVFQQAEWASYFPHIT